MNTPLTHRTDIDGLRAIAVLAIFAFHLGVSGFGGGFAGVDIFFVISGFVILRSVLPQIEGGTFSLRDFYARRLRRIMPALFATILLSLLAGFYLLSPDELVEMAKSALSSIGFAANIFFHNRTGYFAPEAHFRPLLHIWSLGVEEQFYILVPATLLAARKWLKWKGEGIVIGLTLLSFVYGFGAMLWADPAHAFFLPMGRLWEISAGGVMAIAERRSIAPIFGRLGTAALGLVLMLASLFLLTDELPWPGYAALLPVAATMLLIWAGSAHKGAGETLTPLTRALTLPPMQWVGRVSYSIYLLHWPMIVYWQLYTARALNPLEQAIIFAVTLAGAGMMWRFVEQPIRHGRNAVRPHTAWITLGAGAVAAILLSVSVTLTQGLPQRWSDDGLAMLARLDSDKQTRLQCQRRKDLLPDDAGSVCLFAAQEYGDTPPTRIDFIVWGDSHASVIGAEMAEMLRSHGLETGYLANMPGCAPLLHVTTHNQPRRDRCLAYNRALMKAVAAQKPALFIFTSRWAARESDLPAPDTHRIAPDLLDHLNAEQPIKFASALMRTLDAIQASDAKVWLVGPVPELSFNAPDSFLRQLDGRGKMPANTRAHFDARQARVLAALNQAAQRDGVTVFQPSDVFCDDRQCAIAQGKHVLYFDDDHLSPLGAQRLMQIVEGADVPPPRIGETAPDAPNRLR